MTKHTIFDYDKSKPFMFISDKDFKPAVIATIDVAVDVCELIEIEGKIYATCAGSENMRMIGVHEIEIDPEPEEITEQAFTCPYCKSEDHDAWEYSSDKGEVECGYCYSDLRYERHAMRIAGEDWYIEYTVYPVKQKEIIKID